MRQALVRQNMLLVMAAFVALFAVVFWSASAYQRTQRDIFMTMLAEEAALAYSDHEGTPEEFVLLWQVESGRRITVLDSDGRVLADTHDDTVGTDKHDRPEILEPGEVHTRRSETVGIDLLYIAIVLEDGTIIRVSVPMESQASAYSEMVITVFLVGLLLLGLYYAGLVRLNRHIMSPWTKIRESMRGIKDGHYIVTAPGSPYPEINDIIVEMNEINNEISSHVKAVERYRTRLSNVLDVMRQGVMIFNIREELLYLNADAKEIFGLGDDDLSAPLYTVIRDIAIRDAIARVHKDGTPSTFDIPIGDRLYEAKTFSVTSEPFDDKDATALLTMNDVTAKRAIEQMKRDFVAHASHELKSPLTAIRGYAELIELGMLESTEIKDVAGKITDQTKTMTALVEDMLMLSRLEHLKDGERTEVRLDGVLRDVIGSLSMLAKKKNIGIGTDIEPVVFHGDPVDMRTLFKNLIENAIRYSHENLTVEVSLKAGPESVVFVVRDHGIGIASEHRHRVFERFYRIDKGRIEGGTGLGLAIVKHITVKYQGSVDLQSDLGKGTTIKVTLPVSGAKT